MNSLENGVRTFRFPPSLCSWAFFRSNSSDFFGWGTQILGFSFFWFFWLGNWDFGIFCRGFSATSILAFAPKRRLSSMFALLMQLNWRRCLSLRYFDVTRIVCVCFIFSAQLLNEQLPWTVVALFLNKIFARPFIGAMDGHIDAVSCMSKNPANLKGIFSGSMDGGMLLFLKLFLYLKGMGFVCCLKMAIVVWAYDFSSLFV